jgi:hypothetical protein
VVSWRHQGFGQNARQNAIYKSERVWQEAPLPKDSPDPRQPFSADLGGGVSCLVPLVLFGDAKGTLPSPPLVRQNQRRSGEVLRQ